MRQIFRTFLTHDLHLKQTLLLILTPSKRGGSEALACNIFGGFKSVVGPDLRDLLNELLEVTTISAELEAVQVKDVRDSIVEEARVVTEIHKVVLVKFHTKLITAKLTGSPSLKVGSLTKPR
jgi:hypothetical protein